MKNGSLVDHKRPKAGAVTNRRTGSDAIFDHLSPYSLGTTMLIGYGRRLLRMAKGFGHGLGKDARPT
jgi:hypothetical protein